MDITIIYYTENLLAEPLFTKCQKLLKKAANGRPIVSVSHKPIDLGTNICIGVHKRSWLMLYRQLFLGAKLAKTKYVAMAEHDCIYAEDHFSFKPPRDDTFYYNEYNRLVQWTTKKHLEIKGMYSSYRAHGLGKDRRSWRRLALSQMLCNRELLIDSLNKRLDMIDKDRKLLGIIANTSEFGYSKIKKVQKWAESGRPVYLKNMLEDLLEEEKYGIFRTKIPNLDIRHDGNFTGAKRGKQRTFDEPHWGKFEDVINSV